MPYHLSLFGVYSPGSIFQIIIAHIVAKTNSTTNPSNVVLIL